MKTAKKSKHIRKGTLLLALLLLLSACMTAQAEDEYADVTLLLAQDAVVVFGLTDAQGDPMKPRTAAGMLGRGFPDEAGVEPDYRGVVGYATLQTDWEVSRFNTFTSTPWVLPVYERDGDGWKLKEGEVIRHKTPVLVADQVLREEKGHKFRGYLEVIRLDSRQRVWIDVTQFATVPYWTLELPEAMKYGYCIAVYRNRSRYEPMDKKAHRGTVPEGTRVLMCYSNPPKYFSPDRDNNPLLGIIFRSREKSESHFRTFLFFNTEDLTLIY